jgi:pilus assembly protein CpaE
MRNKGILTRISVKNAVIRKKFEEIIASMDNYVVQETADKRAPDLLIFELGRGVEKDFEFIESLLAANAVEEIFLTSEKTESDILLKAMRLGAKEFFSQPLSEAEIRQALERFSAKRKTQQDSMPGRSGKVIHVIGSKGGVGTTTIAVNLSAAIAQSRKNAAIVLIDMNTIGEIPIFLSFNPRHHWGEITKDIDRLDSHFLQNILSKHTSGIQVLSSPGSLNGHVSWTPESAKRMIEMMQQTFDYIVVDGGHSLDKPQLKILTLSDEVLLISLLSLPCLANTGRLLASLKGQAYNQPSGGIRIVVNRYLKKSEVTLKEAEEAVQKEIFWSIPNDYKATMSAINQGKVLNELAPRSAISKSINGLADSLIGIRENPKGNGWRSLGRKRRSNTVV